MSIVHAAGNTARRYRWKAATACLLAAIALATVGVHPRPAEALDPPPVTGPEPTVEDPSPVTTEAQGTIPDQEPLPTTETTAPTQDPTPPFVEPGPGDSLVITPMTISPGQMIEVEARTFRPNAFVWFFLGNPARLPLAESLKQADEFGVFRVTLRVSASAQPGTHPYFANGERADGMRVQFSGWLTVVPAPPTAVTQAGSAAPEADAGESLPRTGTGSLNLGGLGTALVAGGWLLTTVSSRHRNRLESRTSGPADPTS